MKQLVVTLAMLAGLQLGLHAQTYSTLYTFDDGTDGNTISGKLILDTNGNLYGESSGGGSTNCTPRCGTVFELTPNNGVWTKTILYNFLGGTNDGAYPFGGLAFDTAGNIYGTTTAGGLTKSRWNLCEDGCGTIFELSPGQNGWTETILYKFHDQNDGSMPITALTPHGAGNFYGVTTYGGKSDYCDPYGCGTVFKLSPNGHTWKFQVIYDLGSMRTKNISGPLTIDPSGNIYGTAGDEAFKLYTVNGHWFHTILHTFSYKYRQPVGGLILDSSGNLYGATRDGYSTGNYGAVYKLSHATGGWRMTVLYTFQNPEDYLSDGVVMDANGNLYGTSEGGGTNNFGMVYELTRSGSTWVYSEPYDFTSTEGYPLWNLLLDNSGNLYGGTDGLNDAGEFGTIYELQP